MGYCHCHLKCVLRSISWVQTENCTIDKQSPYLKLLLFSKRVLLVIVSETVEWAIAMLVVPLELYCAIVSEYYLSFKLSRKVVFLLGPELPTGDGWERASHWSCITPLESYFSRYDLSFKWSGKVVKDLAMIRDLMRRVCVTVTEIQTWNVAKLFQENVVWLET